MSTDVSLHSRALPFWCNLPFPQLVRLLQPFALTGNGAAAFDLQLGNVFQFFAGTVCASPGLEKQLPYHTTARF